MKIAVPQEIFPNERRVALTPSSAERLAKMGFSLALEAGAGQNAGYPDESYREVGVEIIDSTEALWAAGDIVLKVRPPMEDAQRERHEADLLAEGAHLICFIWPATNEPLLERLAKRNATVVAMDAVPRLSRAQKMDALSSMALIAGYRSVIVAAHQFDSFFAGQITAAGKVSPARVLVIGAGVAGLAAIAAARGLGAIVRAFDTRAAAKDQVRSLGAEFLEVDMEESGEGGGGYAKVMSQAFIDAEMELFRQQAKEVDVVITTALIPGKPAPKLWDARMVESMKRGSVIVDLAAERGGNCELTSPGEIVEKHGVTIIGWTDYTREMAHTASQLYSTNLVHLLEEMGGGEDFEVDLENAVVRGALVLHGGELTWPPPKVAEPTKPAAREKPAPAPEKTAAKPKPAAETEAAPPAVAGRRPVSPGAVALAVAGTALAAFWIYLRISLNLAAPAPAATLAFVQHLTVFVLACFVGWQVIWNVSPALHTPLMSVTNAISGIIILGGLLQGGQRPLAAPAILGALAVLFAMINVAGGFTVTQRMLRMFHKD